LRASERLSRAVPSGLERLLFRAVERKWLNYAVLRPFCKLEAAGSIPAPSTELGSAQTSGVMMR